MPHECFALSGSWARKQVGRSAAGRLSPPLMTPCRAAGPTSPSFEGDKVGCRLRFIFDFRGAAPRCLKVASRRLRRLRCAQTLSPHTLHFASGSEGQGLTFWFY